jgi:hypothetical protein
VTPALMSAENDRFLDLNQQLHGVAIDCRITLPKDLITETKVLCLQRVGHTQAGSSYCLIA